MAKCPFCGREIKELLYEETGVRWGYFDGYHYCDEEFDATDDTHFKCPECFETITTSEDKAAEFLHNGGIHDKVYDSIKLPRGSLDDLYRRARKDKVVDVEDLDRFSILIGSWSTEMDNHLTSELILLLKDSENNMYIARSTLDNRWIPEIALKLDEPELIEACKKILIEKLK
ncbi:hypothetical protein J7L13_01255 [bacterium]|nr:hypothetical protein [bacterium]